MSSATNITVSPSTSLVLIRNLSSPTYVYLSSFTANPFTITVRDTTGLVNIQTSSVCISTVGDARFLDGTNSYFLNKPFGLVNIGFRNPSLWQILHTSGQAPATAAATVTTLYASTLFTSFLSSASKQVSTLTITDLYTTNAITLNNTFVLENLSAPGVVVIQSSLNVFGNVQIDKELFVSGPTQFLSSLFVNSILPISSVVRVFSSVGVGGSLSVGGVLIAGSTFHTLSTNFVESVQIQKSTSDTVFQVNTSLQVQNLVSTLLGVSITDQFVSPSTLIVSRDVSTIGPFTTGSLDVKDSALFTSTLSTFGNSIFLSNLDIKSTLTIYGNGFISTNLTSYGNLYTSSFSTVQLSSLSSFSTRTVQGISSALLQQGLSTAYLQGFGWMSIGSYFYTPAVVSSLTQTRIGGEISILEGATVGSVHVSSSVGIGTDLDVRGDSYLGHAEFQKSLSTFGNVRTLGYTEFKGTVGVGSNLFVDGNMTVINGSEISSFFVNSFLLSNLEILTSSPFVSFWASTLNGSTIQTEVAQIAPTIPEALSVYSTFASTTQFTRAIAENTRVEFVEAKSLFWGDKQTILAEESNPQFIVNTDSYFPKGLSTVVLRAQNLVADLIQGTFLGNGANISNIAVPYANLSALKVFVSSLSTSLLFASSMNVSSFIGVTATYAASSFITPSLVFEGKGYPMRYDTNQFLVVDSNALLLNRGIYINALTNKIGVNLSTPTYELDISGTLYANNIQFSSFQPLYYSTPTTAVFSTILASTTFVRDKLAYATDGISMRTGTDYFRIQGPNAALSNPQFGIYGLQSSISLVNSIQVYNNTNRVIVNGLSSSVFLEPSYNFQVAQGIKSDTAHISSVSLTGALQTQSLWSPSLLIQYPLTSNINILSTTQETLYVNTLLTVKKTLFSSFVGIKTSSPTTDLDVRGNAYFSSVSFGGTPTTKYIALGYQLL